MPKNTVQQFGEKLPKDGQEILIQSHEGGHWLPWTFRLDNETLAYRNIKTPANPEYNWQPISQSVLDAQHKANSASSDLLSNMDRAQLLEAITCALEQDGKLLKAVVRWIDGQAD